MIKWVAILLSLLIFLISSRDLVTYATFNLNQDYISKYLCVNRDKPKMVCNGKCVLKESLAQNHENRDNNMPVPQLEERSVYVLPSVASIVVFSDILYLKKDLIGYEISSYAFEWLEKTFHPPSAFLLTRLF